MRSLTSPTLYLQLGLKVKSLPELDPVSSQTGAETTDPRAVGKFPHAGHGSRGGSWTLTSSSRVLISSREADQTVLIETANKKRPWWGVFSSDPRQPSRAVQSRRFAGPPPGCSMPTAAAEASATGHRRGWPGGMSVQRGHERLLTAEAADRT